jgi:SAM-dependent methyltransferase
MGGAPVSATTGPQEGRNLNYERLYSYRFRDIDQDARIAVWREISPHVHGLMGEPQKVLDPAAGRGEFIGAVPAEETWAVDEVSYQEAAHRPDTTVITSSIMDAELPDTHFDGVFVSNFLEHLPDQEAIASFLEKMNRAMEPGGRIAIMGPNYRYCASEYWDCADHYVALTHVAIAEHLYAAGFEPERIIPRYLPYSFRGILPPSPQLTRLYLRATPAWRLLGKQFLVIGRKVDGREG